MAKKFSELLAEEGLTPEAVAQARAQEGNIKPVTGQAPPTTRENVREGGGAVMNLLGAGGSFIDRFTGAPARAGLEGIISGTKESPKQLPLIQRLGAGTTKGIEAFTGQFGRDPSKAPTGKQIASEELGLSTETLGTKTGGAVPFGVSPAGIAGLTIDVTADPTNLVPVGTAAKTVAKTGKKIFGGGGNVGGGLVDIVTGTKLGTGLTDAVGAGFKKAGEVTGAPFISKEAPDFKKFAEISLRNNIDVEDLPTSVKFGKGSAASKQERFRAQGVGTEADEITFNFEKKKQQVNDAIVNEVDKLSGKLKLDAKNAGLLIRDGWSKRVSNVMDDLEVRYDNAVADPRALIEDQAFIKMDTALNKIKKDATRRAKPHRGEATVKSNEEILGWINAIESGNGSYKQTLEIMRDLGEEAFKAPNPLIAGADKAELKKMYFALRDGLTDTAMFHNPTVGEQLIKNNEILSGLIGEKNTLSKVIGNPNLDDAQLFKSLVQNGNANDYAALKSFFSPDELQAIKGAFINETMNADGFTDIIRAKSTRNTLNRKKTALVELFEEGELQNFNDLLELSDRLGIDVLSTSGTGSTIQILKEAPQQGLEAGIQKFKQRKKGPQTPEFAPAFTDPKAFIQSPGARAKGLQTLSVQQRNE